MEPAPIFQDSEPKLNLQGFAQLLRLLCWSPAYISTPDVMETGVFIWTWLVSAAPSLGSLVLAELVDAWLWTIDTKRGLFASDMRYSGPDAKLRPHLIPGEPEAPPEKDPIEGIIAHRLWLGFFMDRFEVSSISSFYFSCVCVFLLWNYNSWGTSMKRLDSCIATFCALEPQYKGSGCGLMGIRPNSI